MTPTHRCLNCGDVPHWGHLDDPGRYVPGSWWCPICQKDPFWEASGFHYNDWYSKAYSEAYHQKYGEAEWKLGVPEE